MSKSFLPVFLWKFCSLWRYIWVFNPFWVYFCRWYYRMFSFHCFTCSCPVFPAPLIEETVFLHCIFLPSLSWINWPQPGGFISKTKHIFLSYHNPKLWDIPHNNWPVVFKIVKTTKTTKQNKTKLSQIERDWGGMKTKCNVETRIGFWTRKRLLMGQLVISE